MCGAELSDLSQGIAAQVCNQLGGKEINLALVGASNDRIYDTTYAYLQNNPSPDLIVIGWTEFTRVQWFINNGEKTFYEINGRGIGNISNIGDMPAIYQHRLAHWSDKICNKSYSRDVLSLYWHERIFNLHSYLEFLKIPHIFFNAFYAFSIAEKENQLDWNNVYLDPYDNQSTYINVSKKQGFREITPGWLHFEPQAQKSWAERVINHISQYNLLATQN